MRLRITLLIISIIMIFVIFLSFFKMKTSPFPYCGDGICDYSSENCATCPQDCSCPYGKYCYEYACRTEWEVFNTIVNNRGYAMYTHSSSMLDYDSPEVSTLSNKLKANTIKETIYNYFNYAKNIRYDMPIWEDPCYPASETIKKGYGICQNKVRVFMALARKQGIPTKSVEVCINPDKCGWNIICQIVSRLSCHTIAQVFYIEYDWAKKSFNEKWVYVDPTIGNSWEEFPSDLFTRQYFSDEPSCWCYFRCI
jgi:hypothetical protein